LDYRGFPLDPFQETAIGHIDRNSSVLVAAPTGAGKTLIADYAVSRCLAEGARAIYTAPIKALSNQKFRDFTSLYGDKVGIKTGDVTLNPEARVILMTTEIFRNTIFESPESLKDVRYTIFDEIHYLDDIERGTVWEESIIFAPPHIRFLCLSATVPNIAVLADWIRQVRPEVPLEVVVEPRRPVPLRHFIYVPGLGVKKLEQLEKLENGPEAAAAFRKTGGEVNPNAWRARLVDHLAEQDRLPALWFAFNRRECEQFARLVRRPLLNEVERKEILALYEDLLARFAIDRDDPTCESLRVLLSRGTAWHHAGLLPTLKEVVERLFTSGLVRLLFATETFAVGVNMPARTVVFNTLHKFDGVRVAYLRCREHHQMAGRAGRRGIDTEGTVFSVAEWPRMRAAQIRRVIHGEIEPIRSQFNLSYATLLMLYEHLGDKILTAAEKSFANFHPEGSNPAKRSFEHKRGQMKRKLQVLRRLGYIRDKSLTPKGQFAKQIQGYELQVTELQFRGVLRDLDEIELAVLFCGITYESKKSDWHRKSDSPRFKWLRKTAYRAIDEILRAEDQEELEDPTKEPDFRLQSAVASWAGGGTWDELEAHTGASDGDLVRHFRLAIQLLRTTYHGVAADDPARPRLRGAVARLNRGVVDAERQLRMGVSDLAPPEEAPPSAASAPDFQAGPDEL
jgi:superfamily II RNA helicase